MGGHIDFRRDIYGGVSLGPTLSCLMERKQRILGLYRCFTMTKRKLWIQGIIVIAVILIGWAVFVSSQQIERNRRIQAEVSALVTEAAKIRRENETLAEKISYYASADFREQEARRTLGLKKAEETVVVIKPAPEERQKEDDRSTEIRETVQSDTVPAMANYKKWWKLFF